MENYKIQVTQKARSDMRGTYTYIKAVALVGRNAGAH